MSSVTTPRTISPGLLEAIRRTHPLGAAMATLLIQEGTWALADDDGKTAPDKDAGAPGTHAYKGH